MNKLFLSFLLIVLGFTLAKGSVPLDEGSEEESPAQTHWPTLIKVNEEEIEEAIADLKSSGAIVPYHRGDIIIAFIPFDNISSLQKNKRIKTVERSFPRKNELTMDEARNFMGAFRINEGLGGLPQPFDGKGVVIGITDIGFDSRHPNFMNSDLSECRIRQVSQYIETKGIRIIHTDPQEIYDWETDTDVNWHATHVMGIAAGAYSANNFHSLAPAADIVFSGSELYDAGILAGVEDIIAYAKSVDKPAVINLSVGNSVGPKDGSSLFTQYLDRCVDDAIICISSGNDGTTNKGLRYEFTEENRVIQFGAADWSALNNYFEVDAWSADSSPLKFTFYFKNNLNAANNRYFETVDFSDPGTTTWRVSADPDDPDYNELFASNYYTGYIKATGGISPYNGRFNIIIEADCKTDILSPSAIAAGKEWALDWPGFKFEAEPGTKVDFTCGGGSTFLNTQGGFPSPTTELSISNLATGFRTIVVGMTNNKEYEILHDGTKMEHGYKKGEINPYSSYGTLIDGRVLPHTCAPGWVVVSSLSAPFLRANPYFLEYVNTIEEINGENAYWASMSGTSMSCPYVVSVIATWLQADPTLKGEEAKDIILATNNTSLPDFSDPRNGYGWIDPYAGMQMVLSNSALNIREPSLEHVAFRYGEGIIDITNLSGAPVTLELVAISGINKMKRRIDNGFHSISLPSLEPGVYIVNLRNETGMRKTSKIFVR